MIIFILPTAPHRPPTNQKLALTFPILWENICEKILIMG